MHSISNLEWALHVHLWIEQVQCNSHGGTMFFGGLLLNVPAFISV
jgi:hypothetical protein